MAITIHHIPTDGGIFADWRAAGAPRHKAIYHIAIDRAGTALCGDPSTPFTGKMALPEHAFGGALEQRQRIRSAHDSGEMCGRCFSDWAGADAEVHIIPDALADAPIALCGRSADMCGDIVDADDAVGMAIDGLCAECDSAVNGGYTPEFTEALIRMRDAENAARNRIVCAECGNRFAGDAYGRGCICKQGADAVAYLADIGSRRARRAMDGAKGGE